MKENTSKQLTEKRVREIVREEIRKILAKNYITSLQFEESIDRESKRLSRKRLNNK